MQATMDNVFIQSDTGTVVLDVFEHNVQIFNSSNASPRDRAHAAFALIQNKGAAAILGEMYAWRAIEAIEREELWVHLQFASHDEFRAALGDEYTRIKQESLDRRRVRKQLGNLMLQAETWIGPAATWTAAPWMPSKPSKAFLFASMQLMNGMARAVKKVDRLPLLRAIYDSRGSMPGRLAKQVELTRGMIEWAKDEENFRAVVKRIGAGEKRDVMGRGGADAIWQGQARTASALAPPGTTRKLSRRATRWTG